MPCPIPGCTSNVRAGHLMCSTHWRMVPRAKQIAVNKAWRAVLHADDVNDSLEALAEYRKERAAAIAGIVASECPLL